MEWVRDDMSLRSTAANLSKIKKPGIPKKLLLPLKKAPRKRGPAPEPQDSSAPLEVLQHNVYMDFRLNSASLLDALDRVAHNQWAEQTLFHERHFLRDAKLSASQNSDLLFLLRGLSMETKADIIKYRALQLPLAAMVTVNQLYLFFEDRGNTYVDRALELCLRDGLVRKFVITNALPVIQRTQLSPFQNLVSYGYENVELVVRLLLYLAEIDRCAREDPSAAATLEKFRAHVEAHPAHLDVTSADFLEPERAVLVKKGFITLTSNHNHEIDIHHFAITYPRCGTFLKIITAGRGWVVKTLNKAPFKESLQELLFERWEGKALANFRKPFYGYDLLLVLADAKGAGVVEAFSTPVGRGWRLTGKL